MNFEITFREAEKLISIHSRTTYGGPDCDDYDTGPETGEEILRILRRVDIPGFSIRTEGEEIIYTGPQGQYAVVAITGRRGHVTECSTQILGSDIEDYQPGLFIADWPAGHLLSKERKGEVGPLTDAVQAKFRELYDETAKEDDRDWDDND